MIRVLRLAIAPLMLSASAVAGQTPSPDAAKADSNAVTEYSIRSGKLMLSSLAAPKPVALPDGVYTNQSDLTIAILGGKVTRIRESTGEITEIASMRLNRDRLVRLMPATNALMAVTEVPLPSGTFKSEDGRNSVTIVFGRPTAFRLSPGGN